jgi:hypothetical protein
VHACRENQTNPWGTAARTRRGDNYTDRLQQITGRQTICEKSGLVAWMAN